jgi:hypothetical protein
MSAKRLFMGVGLLFALGFALALPVGPAMAGIEVCDDGIDNDQDGATDCKDSECTNSPACEKERSAACSPGYYKNHISAWCNIECPTGVIISPTSCQLLLGTEGLNATGPANGVKKNIAASFINTTCFVTAEESPCEED